VQTAASYFGERFSHSFSYGSEILSPGSESDVIAHDIFTSVPDLARKLRRYINAYFANAKPIQ